MIKKLILAGVAVASLSAPAFAENKVFNLGDIDPGQAATAQFRHFQRRQSGQGPIVGGQPTEVYSSAAKAFTDNVFFNISRDGIGAGVFTVQFLAGGTNGLKNITNGKLTLLNQTTNQTLFSNSSLISGAQFAIPFAAGSYRAIVSGNASGSRGGDYQISFAAPVPEPAVIGSMAAGIALAGFAASRRRRKAAANAA